MLTCGEFLDSVMATSRTAIMRLPSDRLTKMRETFLSKYETRLFMIDQGPPAPARGPHLRAYRPLGLDGLNGQAPGFAAARSARQRVGCSLRE